MPPLPSLGERKQHGRLWLPRSPPWRDTPTLLIAHLPRSDELRRMTQCFVSGKLLLPERVLSNDDHNFSRLSHRGQ